jgi:hypothetical protein
MYLLTQIKAQIEAAKTQLDKQQAILQWVDQNQEKFNDLPTAIIFNENIDFDNLAHNEVMTVVLRFGGKWDRTPCDGKINYTRKQTDDCPVVIRCYKGTPPPGCRVEYEEVTIPARVERRAKLNCKPLQELVNEVQSLPEPTVLLSVPDEIPF